MEESYYIFNKNLRKPFFLSFSFAPKRDGLYRNFFKSLLDFVVAFIGCVFLLPVFLFVAVILSIANNGTPFFLQMRPGKDGKLFRIIKFKTMSDARDEFGNLLSDEQRLTKIGKFVRKTSLDEIPQLINVLKGDMSLIGPRPLLPEYLDLYDDFQRKRHKVKPGITGLAAVNGRNTLDWNKKFDLDVWYVENLSFFLDVKIIFKTFKKVVLSEGVSPEGQSIMPRFSEYVKKKIDEKDISDGGGSTFRSGNP